MKTLNVPFTEEEYAGLLRLKGPATWRAWLLGNEVSKLDTKDGLSCPLCKSYVEGEALRESIAALIHEYPDQRVFISDWIRNGS